VAGDLHHISTTRDGQEGALTVTDGYRNLAADLLKHAKALLRAITLDTLPR
jgi:hypothetical protein